MADVILTLGGVPFRHFEVPEQVRLETIQRISVLSLYGGGQVITPTGFDPGQIQFSGIFSDVDAVARCQSLNAACVAGTVIPLSWDAFSYFVIIKSFIASYKNRVMIPFSITCKIVDNTRGTNPVGKDSTSALISADLTSAESLAEQANISLPNVLVPSSAGFLAVNSFVTSVRNENGLQVSYNNSLVNNTVDAAIATNAVLSIVNSTAQLAASTGILGYIDRATTYFSGILA